MPKVSMRKLRVEYGNYVGACRKNCDNNVMTFEEFVEFFGNTQGMTVVCGKGQIKLSRIVLQKKETERPSRCNA